MKNNTVKVDIYDEVEIPLLPNYIRTTSGRAIPISALSESDIKKISLAWKKALIKKSKTFKSVFA